MLPIVLPAEDVLQCLNDAKAGLDLHIDLPAQTITRSNGEIITFNVNEFRKHCLVNGLDDIGLTLQKIKDIESFEGLRTLKYPWLNGPDYVKIDK